MIASVSRGDRTRGILAYVYGPGDQDEHTNQRTVAGFEDLLPDPGLAEDQRRALNQLAKILDLRVVQAGQNAPKDHVWHCSLRAAPEDRRLEDADWEQIARRVMHAAGIAPAGDPDACRWVVVRHAEDHVHIVATTVRADLTQARIHGDWRRIMDELTLIEEDYGLRKVERAPAGKRTAHTTAKRPTRAEVHKARREGRPEPARAVLRTAVREALAGAANEEEFQQRIAEHGVIVKVHRLPSGDARGYSFRLPGDDDAAGQPVWYSGSSLGPDLTLPRIRARLAVAVFEPNATVTGANSARPALQQAGLLADQLLTVFVAPGAVPAPDPQTWQARAAGVGEVLDALAQSHFGSQRAQIAAAAKAYGHAAHLYTRAANAEDHALRTAARILLAGGPTNGRGKDGDAFAALLDILVLIAVTLAREHRAAGNRQHARAAQSTADQLRSAYHQAAAKPLTAMTARGQRLPKPVQDQNTAAVRAALPADLAGRVLGDRDWPALAATLADARTCGHDPATLLQGALATREMESADNPAAVLLWRIRRTTDLPAPTTPPPTRRKPAREPMTTPVAHPSAPAPAPRRR
ncbi:relaxase/mobilization nuclease domain-containing protein [Streptacidiphilus cavernicola]|uniref:Relaxase/mobilization nuclease domain-containing protein n=1 Tax=Streptacidiphilus cavernicola TaxID=3342716 RepID=A0ABV6VVI8_9ACTN